MSKERYTVECLASGQPRAYADSRYLYRVTIEWQGLAGFKDKDAPFVPRPELERTHVERVLRGLCGGWMDQPHACARQLSSMKMIAPGVWEVDIVEPFTD